MTQQQKKRGVGVENEGCNAESVACSEVGRGTMLEAYKVWVTCSSTRGLNIYLFVTQGSLTVKGIVVKRGKREGGAIRVERV